MAKVQTGKGPQGKTKNPGRKLRGKHVRVSGGLRDTLKHDASDVFLTLTSGHDIAVVLRGKPSGALNLFGPEGREALRQQVDKGLPVDTVKELQEELRRLGVPRPSAYVESIATRAARSRRDTLTPQEGERLVRIATVLARALAVWENEEDAADFLTRPHPELGADSPIDRARSEIGARQVEDLLLKLDLGLPV